MDLAPSSAIQALNGLASASSLFITACGLTIVFGVTRIVNFAHGSLYMLGAYIGGDAGAPAARPVASGRRLLARASSLAALAVGLLGVAHRGAAAAAHLPRAGAVPAARHLRRRARGAGSRGPDLRARRTFSARARPACARRWKFSAGGSRPTSSCSSPPAPLVLGCVWLLLRTDPVRHPGAGGDAGSRDGGALGVNQAVLFTGTLLLGAFLAGLGGALQIPRAAGQSGHGPVDHRRGLRRHRGRRHGQRAGRVPGGAHHRPAAGLRHPDLPQDHPRAGLPAHGRGAGRPALRASSAAPETVGGAHASASPAAAAGRARTWHGRWLVVSAPRAAFPLVADAYAPEGRDRDPDLRALRLQPAAAHRRRRARQLRPCRLLRPRRLWRGARASSGSARRWRRPCRWRRSRPPPARPLSAPSWCGCPASISPC